MIEDLLNELANSGWSVSWAFQFAPDHWRVSIIQYTDIGEAPGTYISFCADAPTFQAALEDAMLRRNDNPEWTPTPATEYTCEPTQSLIDILRLKRHLPKLERRI